MILVLAGIDGMPFDRLVRVIDRWAADADQPDVIAVVGQSRVKARHITTTRALEPADLEKVIADASLVVSDASIPTVLRVMSAGKPLIVMPRRSRGRVDPGPAQGWAVTVLPALRLVTVVTTEDELAAALDRPGKLFRASAPARKATVNIAAAFRVFSP